MQKTICLFCLASCAFTGLTMSPEVHAQSAVPVGNPESQNMLFIQRTTGIVTNLEPMESQPDSANVEVGQQPFQKPQNNPSLNQKSPSTPNEEDIIEINETITSTDPAY